NNVIFNWWNRSADGGDNNSKFQFINNYYKPGPITPLDQPIGHRILKPESGRDKEHKEQFGKAYVAGNIVEGNEKVTKDNWDGGVQPAVTKEPLDKALAQIRVDQPFDHASITILPADKAYEYVLANVGATLPKRDAVDLRVIDMVRTGKVSAKPGPNFQDAFSHVGY